MMAVMYDAITETMNVIPWLHSVYSSVPMASVLIELEKSSFCFCVWVLNKLHSHFYRPGLFVIVENYASKVACCISRVVQRTRLKVRH